METMNIFEAIRRATDPTGIDGQATAAERPSAKEVLERLSTLGYVVVPRPLTKVTFTAVEPREGIEQFQAEDR